MHNRLLRESRNSELLPTFRVLLLVEGLIYLAWWFFIHSYYPQAYDPFLLRIPIVLLSLTILAVSLISQEAQKRIEFLFYFSLFALTTHNFYLIYRNFSDLLWPSSVYLTIVAVCVCFHSRKALLFYSAYVMACGIVTSLATYTFYPFFIPGLLTVLTVSNLALYHRHRILNRLAEATNRFQELFHSTFEGILLHSQGKIVDVNEPFAQMLGYTRIQLLGIKVIDLVRDLDKAVAREAEISNTPRFSEIFLVKRNGEQVPVEISVKQHFWDGRAVKLVTVKNISERLAAESHQREKLEAEANVKLRDEFISIASHELKTPLTPIRLNNDMLLRAIRDNNFVSYTREKLTHMFEMTSKQIDRLCRLIDDMLEVSRINRGQLALSPEHFDLKELLEEVVAAFSDELKRGGTQIKLEHLQPVDVWWDRFRMEQVLVNLVRNASLYGKGNAIEISLQNAGEILRLSISDQGIGIAEKDLSRIFQRFERAVSSKNYGGMGLGLYISDQIVKAHQGQIFVESQFGKGSVFTIQLPTRPAIN